MYPYHGCVAEGCGRRHDESIGVSGMFERAGCTVGVGHRDQEGLVDWVEGEMEGWRAKQSSVMMWLRDMALWCKAGDRAL